MVKSTTPKKTFKRATKEQGFLRLGLVGPSGSGKTYTALSVSEALGKNIAVIDSERGSASKYADEFTFDSIELDTFAPFEYIEAIEAAVAAKYDVLIIDSLSHAWMGKGGVLEMHDEATIRDRTGNSYTSWRTVTPEHNRLVEAILQAPLHVIVTMRAKTAYVQEKDEQTGKTRIRKVGLQPVQRGDLEYEMDVVGDMDQENMFVVTKTRCKALRQAVIPSPSAENLGRTLHDWITGGSTPRATQEQLVQLSAGAKTAGLTVAQLIEHINKTLNTSYASPRDMTTDEAVKVLESLARPPQETPEQQAG